MRDRGYSSDLRPRAIRLKFSQVFFRPAAKRVQRLNQGPAQSREGVFHFRRHDWMHFALHEAIALEAAQSLGEHLLRNPADRALEFGITHRSARQDLNNERRPLIGNPLEDKP